MHGETRALRLSGEELTELVITPEDAGLERAPLNAVQGGGPQENAERVRTILDGAGTNAENAIVALNTAALLTTAGRAPTLKDGADMAMDALIEGEPGRVLDAYIEASRG